MVRSFRHDANQPVETVLLHDKRVLTGGYFTKINGTSYRYFVSLSPGAGVPGGYLHLNISGHYQYPGVASNGTRVYNQQLSPKGDKLLVEGDFTSVSGRSRQRICPASGLRRPARDLSRVLFPTPLWPARTVV